MNTEARKILPKVYYPCLMIHRDHQFVVFFKEPSVGMIVHAEVSSIFAIGDLSTSWCMTAFEPYDGEIVMRNSK